MKENLMNEENLKLSLVLNKVVKNQVLSKKEISFLSNKIKTNTTAKNILNDINADYKKTQIEIIEKIIQHGKPKLDFYMQLISREDLKSSTLETILSKISPFIAEQTEIEFSTPVLNYIAKNHPDVFNEILFDSVKDEEYIKKLLESGNLSELQITSVCNNVFISEETRNMAFDKGVIPTQIYNTTDYIQKQTYDSLVDVIFGETNNDENRLACVRCFENIMDKNQISESILIDMNNRFLNQDNDFGTGSIKRLMIGQLKSFDILLHYMKNGTTFDKKYAYQSTNLTNDQKHKCIKQLIEATKTSNEKSSNLCQLILSNPMSIPQNLIQDIINLEKQELNKALVNCKNLTIENIMQIQKTTTSLHLSQLLGLRKNEIIINQQNDRI